tara:strand:+ start:157 stop:330 length:174 start_codon:yes stop_codon:yes gene_type:complete
MKKLTQEELNALSPRARKQYENSEVISEILTENPNKEEPIEIDLFDEEQEELKKKDK